MMSGLTIDGISSTLGQYSGVTAGTIEKLLTASSIYQRKTDTENEITEIENKESAWSTINSELSTFLDKVEVLQSDDTYLTKTATSSDSSVATISGTTAAAEDSYDLKVDQLATATKVTGSKLDVTGTKTALNIAGTLTLTNSDTDSQSASVTISSTDTLKSLAQKINALTNDSTDSNGNATEGTHIKASIVDNRLVLTSTTQGANTISLSGEDSSGNELADDLGLGSQATTSTGQSAIFELDGMTITRNTNTVTDAVEGVTFNLNQVSDEDVTLSLTNDTSNIVSAVQDMVSSYNTLMSTIKDDLDVGDPSSSSNTTGPLVGDSELMLLESSLSSMVTSSKVSGSSLNATDLGISFSDIKGTLSVDTDKLESAISKDATAVKNFFYSAKTTSDGNYVISTSGYTSDLSDLVNKYISTDSLLGTSIIGNIQSSYKSQVEELNDQVDTFDDQLDTLKEQYIEKYTALDEAIMEGEEELSEFTSASSSLSS
ncbi:flagellar filament capping protein FliD [Liquorilactobacillus vini]|uniref:Flagellar hook-associated protein 2 n=2 Tax=Liquorilactobacillus vini DSM 20605 TaxID=1133569 RepID=A0A0A7RGU9_9LACO|nr:flagellar filament capping protein FliD [Liquorilactobacillus vini]AJA34466.1 flagellar hook-associated protein 2 [Liquorilactobacillus vini DSM 20605]